MAEPKEKLYCFDFHTHEDDGVVEPGKVYSYSLREIDRIPADALYTIGLHPWDTDRLDAYRLVDSRLEEAIQNPRCLAVGEIGLDRLRGAKLEVQLELFKTQLDIAARHGKPIVVHCVRAWSEMLKTVRDHHFEGNRAVHGFLGRDTILKRLLYDDWYVSVGVMPSGKVLSIAAQIPRERILVETDASGNDCEEVYEKVAAVRRLRPYVLKDRVSKNARRFFKS